MVAYVIIKMDIHNRDWMDEYFEHVPAIIESYGGRFVVSGGRPQVLEGKDSAPDEAFILEFPSRKHAISFWECDDFAPFMKRRQAGATYEAVLVGEED